MGSQRAPVVVAGSSENQYLEDAFGDYIVYTLSPSLNAPGDIVLYQISTATSGTLTSTGDCFSPRIYGQYVIWLENVAAGTQLVLYNVSSGIPAQTTVMAGPVPSVGTQLLAAVSSPGHNPSTANMTLRHLTCNKGSSKQ
jgi:hypothetical protein